MVGFVHMNSSERHHPSEMISSLEVAGFLRELTDLIVNVVRSVESDRMPERIVEASHILDRPGKIGGLSEGSPVEVYAVMLRDGQRIELVIASDVFYHPVLRKNFQRVHTKLRRSSPEGMKGVIKFVTLTPEAKMLQKLPFRHSKSETKIKLGLSTAQQIRAEIDQLKTEFGS